LWSEIPNSIYAKLCTVAASNNRDHSIIACSHHVYILLFFAHILFVVNHTFNTTVEVATTSPYFHNEPHQSHILCEIAEPGTTFTSWSQHHFVAIGKPERYMRKASHYGSKQQQRSQAVITLLLLVDTTYIYCCSSRTSRSCWITHSTQCHQRGCNNAQLVTIRLKHGFNHLKYIDCEGSDVWKSFGCQWEEWAAWFCCLLDVSSDVRSF